MASRRRCVSSLQVVSAHEAAPWWPSQQRDAGRLPQLTGQLVAVLEDALAGDDAQVDGQQLIALDYLCLMVLSVVPQ